jgi:capsular polysaccharide transport system ATP-binding protein
LLNDYCDLINDNMIKLNNISKTYVTKGIRKQVFRGLNFEFKSDRNYALLGSNGVGKSTLLRLLAGGEEPDKGSITRNGKVSWPMGFSGGFNGSMTGIENIRFVARIYGQDPKRVIKYVYEFSELGKSITLPMKSYSSGMRARLAFGLSLAIDFDCYLVDEIVAVGDAKFKRKSKQAFQEKFDRSFLIMASHGPAIIKEYCDCGILLNHGSLEFHDSIDSLLQAYRKVNSV